MSLDLSPEIELRSLSYREGFRQPSREFFVKMGEFTIVRSDNLDPNIHTYKWLKWLHRNIGCI